MNGFHIYKWCREKWYIYILIDKINGRAFLCMLSMSPENVIEFDDKKVIAKTNATWETLLSSVQLEYYDDQRWDYRVKLGHLLPRLVHWSKWNKISWGTIRSNVKVDLRNNYSQQLPRFIQMYPENFYLHVSSQFQERTDYIFHCYLWTNNLQRK